MLNLALILSPSQASEQRLNTVVLLFEMKDLVKEHDWDYVKTVEAIN